MFYIVLKFILGSAFICGGIFVYKIYQILTIEKDKKINQIFIDLEKDQNYKIIKNEFLRKRNIIILKNDSSLV